VLQCGKPHDSCGLLKRPGRAGGTTLLRRRARRASSRPFNEER
jgi:hypothetical protein